MTSGGALNVAITYLDDGNQDGAGSQLLRIYGIYAISRHLGVSYVHSPIAHLKYHGLAALENNAPSPDLLQECNRVFDIPSDVEVPENAIIHNMVDADAESILKIKNDSSEGTFHLIRILYPFPITDSNPELYQSLEAVSPFPYRKSAIFRLAIHVRRGELFAVSSDWMLPNSYYVQCVLNFQRILKELDISFVCELYTEVASQIFEVTPQHHGIEERISGNITIDPAMNHLEDFDDIPNLERYINLDPIESLTRMATADALILSHSSFSYLPAILNPNRIVVYHPYWRSAMKDWLISNDEGALDESILTERLESWAPVPMPVQVIDLETLNQHIQGLLLPFAEQSVRLRSIVSLDFKAKAESFGVVTDQDNRPAIVNAGAIPRAPPSLLDGLAQQARVKFGHLPGDDLLLLPEPILNDALNENIGEVDNLSFRAVAVVGARGSAWKLRRALFDRGLVCVGSAGIAGCKAFCFLASDAVQSFNHLAVEPRGHITMATFLEGAGFANLLWRYACVKLYALRHGLTPALPAWEGNQLFGLEDKSYENLHFPQREYAGFAQNDRELWYEENPPVDIDLRGFFQEIPECWRKHRPLLRHLFQPSSENVEALDAWRDAVTDGGRRTLVAISVRRGDYRKLQIVLPQFRFVPVEWYLDWLRALWPTLQDPLLFVTTDEPETVLPNFQEFEPNPGPLSSLPRYVRDFEVLRRADYLAICNSSFPRMAAILAPSMQRCFIPSFETQSFEPYEPWIDPAFWVRFGPLPSGRYLPISDQARICVSGWHIPEASGVRAAQPVAIIRFCADSPVGNRINLILRFAAPTRDFHIRVSSASGDETEVALAAGSGKLAVLPCTVEPDNMITATLLTTAGEFSSEPSGWAVEGILYFRPPSKVS